MATLTKLINYEDARPMGIGRIVSLDLSTSKLPGILFGGGRGLYHADGIYPDGDLAAMHVVRIRRNPVGWFVSSGDGVAIFEEEVGHGRMAFLDEDLREIYSNEGLAREIAPRAIWSGGVIKTHGRLIEHIKIPGGEVTEIARIQPFRFMSQFTRVNGGFEFIVVHRGDGWPTFLYRLELGHDIHDGGNLIRIAKSDGPIITSVFTRLSNGQYLVVQQGRLLFEIFRAGDTGSGGLHVRKYFAFPPEVRPVGVAIIRDRLFTCASDNLIVYRLGQE